MQNYDQDPGLFAAPALRPRFAAPSTTYDVRIVRTHRRSPSNLRLVEVSVRIGAVTVRGLIVSVPRPRDASRYRCVVVWPEYHAAPVCEVDDELKAHVNALAIEAARSLFDEVPPVRGGYGR